MLGQPPRQLHIEGRRQRGPAGQRLERGGQAAVARIAGYRSTTAMSASDSRASSSATAR